MSIFERLFYLVVLLVVLFFYSCEGETINTIPVEDALLITAFENSEGGTYKVPSKAEVQKAQHLFERLFTGKEPKPKAWDSLDFNLKRFITPFGSYWAIQEKPSDKEGRGWYVIAIEVGDEKQNVLLAPHRNDDLLTGKIAFSLLKAGSYSGGAWNTIERENVDLAHIETSFFNAFTHAWAATHSNDIALEIHGFAKANHPNIQKAGVVSSGTNNASTNAQNFTICLNNKLIKNVALYGIDVFELGGTTNEQGKLLRNLGHVGFIHLEMNYELRTNLVQSNDKLNFINTCLP